MQKLGPRPPARRGGRLRPDSSQHYITNVINSTIIPISNEAYNDPPDERVDGEPTVWRFPTCRGVPAFLLQNRAILFLLVSLIWVRTIWSQCVTVYSFICIFHFSAEEQKYKWVFIKLISVSCCQGSLVFIWSPRAFQNMKIAWRAWGR